MVRICCRDCFLFLGSGSLGVVLFEGPDSKGLEFVRLGRGGGRQGQQLHHAQLLFQFLQLGDVSQEGLSNLLEFAFVLWLRYDPAQLLAVEPVLDLELPQVV